MLDVNERMDVKLFGREIIFQEFQCFWTRYLIVTDGQTDGRTTYCRITALCASIARPIKCRPTIPLSPISLHRVRCYSLCIHMEGWSGWVGLGDWLYITIFLSTDGHPIQV